MVWGQDPVLFFRGGRVGSLTASEDRLDGALHFSDRRHLPFQSLNPVLQAIDMIDERRHLLPLFSSIRWFFFHGENVFRDSDSARNVNAGDRLSVDLLLEILHHVFEESEPGGDFLEKALVVGD